MNCANIPVEVHETNNPVLVRRFELIPDTGGAGLARRLRHAQGRGAVEFDRRALSSGRQAGFGLVEAARESIAELGIGMGG